MDIKSVKKLNNGTLMPVLGLGVFKSADDTYQAVRWALDAGYRHIDTAMIYHNEAEVGRAIRDSGIRREDVFLTTKLWNDDMRNHRVEEAFSKSLKLLGTDYVDLYLIHWPVKGEFIPAYKVMEEIYSRGEAKAIGVSNFLPHHLEELAEMTDIVPSVDQVEIHPYLVNQELFEYCKARGIAVESWSPLARGKVLEDPLIREIAARYGKTPAQTVNRWHIERGLIVIPKSVHKERIEENADIFDFELKAEEMEAINGLDRNMRTGSHPDYFKF
jgi:diketogulonate reductase-like aldo/keto reductase